MKDGYGFGKSILVTKEGCDLKVSEGWDGFNLEGCNV